MYKKNIIYKGKSKDLYNTDNTNFLIMHFRNDVSANNGKKNQFFEDKGILNNKFNYFIMNKLSNSGINTHTEELFSENETLVKKLNMIPLEFVIRNYATGSLIKRIKIKEGVLLNPPIFEIFLKNDEFNDPMINDSYCETFGWINKYNLKYIKEISLKINNILTKLFNQSNMLLIDFKIEFGMINNQIILGDEFSPDGSRIWDKYSKKRMDKDLFRYNQKGLIDAYKEVSNRLGIVF